MAQDVRKEIFILRREQELTSGDKFAVEKEPMPECWF